jgi:hypothetical protein
LNRTVRSATRVRGRGIYGNDCIDHSYSVIDRRIAHMALQLRMGLLSKRRARPGIFDRLDPPSLQANLMRSSGATSLLQSASTAARQIPEYGVLFLTSVMNRVLALSSWRFSIFANSSYLRALASYTAAQPTKL